MTTATPQIFIPNTVVKPLSWLRPSPTNPRVNDGVINALAESIQTFGFLVPIVASDTGEIIAGHSRYLAALQLGAKSVLVIVAKHLTAHQLEAFRLIDNKVAELAEWNWELYAEQVAGLTSAGFDLSTFGWDKDEITDLINQHNGVTESNTKEVDKNPASTTIAIGKMRFYIAKEAFAAWLEAQRRAVKYDDDKLIAHLAKKLGLLDDHNAYQTLREERAQAASTAIKDTKAQQQAAPNRVAPRRVSKK